MATPRATDIDGPANRRVAVLAGRGILPALVADAATRAGWKCLVFPIVGEGDPAAFGALPVHPLRWGEVGKLFRLASEFGCQRAVFIGAIASRPDYRSVIPDFGAIKLIPRMVQLLRGGDDSLLSGVAEVFEERGIKLVSPLDLAPDLALPEGLVVGRQTADSSWEIEHGSEAARLIGRLDVGQGAVAVGRRVVALEDAGGTDALLERVGAMRRAGRIARSGGVLVKCMKPNQDSRIDLPTIGADTAHNARAAGLDGIAADAGRTLLADPARTYAAFRETGLFLVGMPAPPFADG